jgi:hypothetical protein
MLVLIVIFAGVIALITGAAIWTGIKTLGTPADRAAANLMLQQVAVLLGGRFRQRDELPWYRRPAQYGFVGGELEGLCYELFLMPWNAEDCGGEALLAFWPARAPAASSRRVFAPAQLWHWPDRADPSVLAGYVRQAITSYGADAGLVQRGPPQIPEERQ